MGVDMALKHDLRRKVPDWLSELDPARLESASFPLANVLKHSLYYPSAGFDGRPVQFLGGFIHSFVYVDYGNSERDVEGAIKEHGFLGYHVAGKQNLTQSELAPQGWQPHVPEQYRSDVERFRNYENGLVKRPFAIWYILDRDEDKSDDFGPERFSLLYLCADGVAAYQALYWQNHTAPEVLAIIQPGTGFGGNYTNFTDPEGFFAWTVLHGNGKAIPEFLVYGGMGMDYTESCWPESYPEHVEWFQHMHGNGVWRRGGVNG